MNHPVIPIAVLEGATQAAQAPGTQRPAGRPGALARGAAAAGHESRQRDLLIEHLHKIQDRFGHLSAAHLAALAQEMRLAQTEVYEVATFYHHFDVVKEGDDAPPALTVRVCDGLSCEMAGARDLLDKLPAILGRDVRVLAAPCIGRCEQAPAAVVGQNPVPHATVEEIVDARCRPASTRHEPERLHRLAAYRAQGGYELLQALRRRPARCRVDHQDARRLGPARPGRRGLSGRPQMAHRARRSGPAPDGGQHRRRRARHLQGPHAARARSAPLHRRHADRRLGGRHRRSATSICATNTTAAARCSKPNWTSCAPTRRCPTCRRSSCAAAPAPTSAAKSRR